MLTAENIRPLKSAAIDFEETERLKQRFIRLRTERQPLFLDGNDMEQIFRWKLGQQYGRQAKLRLRNSEAAYREVTRAAFAITSDDDKYEAQIRVRLLTALPGIGVPVASAILALVDPERYCVIDFRGWRAAFGERRKSFDISHYLRYLQFVSALARELGWTPQETDLAIWEIDRRRHSTPNSLQHQ